MRMVRYGLRNEVKESKVKWLSEDPNKLHGEIVQMDLDASGDCGKILRVARMM